MIRLIAACLVVFAVAVLATFLIPAVEEQAGFSWCCLQNCLDDGEDMDFCSDYCSAQGHGSGEDCPPAMAAGFGACDD